MSPNFLLGRHYVISPTFSARLRGGFGVVEQEQNLVIADWTGRYLGAGVLRESEYDQALAVAQRLQHSGLVSSTEWIAMVRQANAALLMCAEGDWT